MERLVADDAVSFFSVRWINNLWGGLKGKSMYLIYNARKAVGTIRKALGIEIIGNGFDHLLWNYLKGRLAVNK